MEVFSILAVVLGLAAGGGIVARMVKQPAMLGYIAAGMVVAAGLGKWPEAAPLVETMGQVGVTLLLFLAGMELPLSELKKLGRVAVITGLGQVAVSASLGYGLARVMGWGSETAVYLGLGLTFGSTILMVKLLTEKGDLQSLAGKIAVGYLLVQDFVAVGVLVVLAGLGRGGVEWTDLGWVVVKALVLVGVALTLSGKLIEKAIGYLARSTELLFIVAIGWCLLVAAGVSAPQIGFSIEIGGFLAGLVLANAVEQAQIAARVRPVRDFFLTWFFVALGARVEWTGGWMLVVMTVGLAVYVMVINPLVVMTLLGWQGYRKRAAFMAALAVTSVSEFSLIVAAAAVAAGVAGNELLTVLTMVALLTMTGETYIVNHAEKIYVKLAPWLSWLERKKVRAEEIEKERLEGHVVLFGHNRIGSVIRPVLEKLGRVVVVDFNPKIVEGLSEVGVRVVYGDMSDFEMYEELGIGQAKLVVSTVPDVADSLRFLGETGRMDRKPVTIMTAPDGVGAGKLYRAGADLVLVPHSVGGEYIAGVLTHGKEEWEGRVREVGKHHWERIKRG